MVSYFTQFEYREEAPLCRSVVGLNLVKQDLDKFQLETYLALLKGTLVHPSAARYAGGRSFLFFFFYLSHESFSGEHQRRNRGGVLQSQACHFRWVDDAHLH